MVLQVAILFQAGEKSSNPFTPLGYNLGHGKTDTRRKLEKPPWLSP